MPKLLQRGCALEGCHSPDGFNDFRLRSGAHGFFAPLALAPQLRGAGGRVHGARHRRRQAVARGEEEHRRRRRAGPPTAPGRSSRTSVPDRHALSAAVRRRDRTRAPSACSRNGTASSGTDRAATVSAMASGSTLPLAFVSRPPNGDTLLQFDTFAGGADLKLADATLDANGGVTTVGNIRSALGPCAGLTGRQRRRARPRVELRRHAR